MSKKTNRKYKVLLLLLPVLAFVAVAVWYLHRTSIPVLEPAGQVGQKERNLMFFALILSAVVVIPVYAMTVAIVLKYREGNHRTKKVKYSPDWDHSRLFESIWWGIPCAIILVLSIVTWQSSHALDPFKPLNSSAKPVTVQVVALDWKWLFIYPSQHIASVNVVEMPVNTPVDFQITSDTVMNSFWIPQLGGQIYAMPGMSTQLHLMADKTGSFRGSSANISGAGFASMTFTAKSVSRSDFNSWVRATGSSSGKLDMSTYNQLARPSYGHPVAYYSSVQGGLYNDLIMKYMLPNNSQYIVTPAMQGMTE